MPRPFRWGVVQALRDELASIDSQGRLPSDNDDAYDASDPMFPTIQFCEFWIDQPFRLGPGEDHGEERPALLINDDIGASPVIGAATQARLVSQNPSSRYVDGADLGPFGNDSGHVEWPMVFQVQPRDAYSDPAQCEALFMHLAGIQKVLSKVRRDKDNILGFGNRYPCVMNVEWGRGYVRKDERTGEALALLRVTLTVMENYENPWVD